MIRLNCAIEWYADKSELNSNRRISSVRTTLNAGREEIRGVTITDSPYDVINMCQNRPKPYRIVYSPDKDLYAIADAYEMIHEDICNIMIREGFLSRQESIRCTQGVFYPTDTTDTSFEGKYVAIYQDLLYTTIGIFGTIFGMEEDFPELLKILKTRGLLANTTEHLKIIEKNLKEAKRKQQDLIQLLQSYGLTPLEVDIADELDDEDVVAVPEGYDYLFEFLDTLDEVDRNTLEDAISDYQMTSTNLLRWEAQLNGEDLG